ncbi:hypothetical protein [Helicobacter sp. T3_23-1056]
MQILAIIEFPPPLRRGLGGGFFRFHFHQNATSSLRADFGKSKSAWQSISTKQKNALFTKSNKIDCHAF